MYFRKTNLLQRPPQTCFRRASFSTPIKFRRVRSHFPCVHTIIQSTKTSIGRCSYRRQAACSLRTPLRSHTLSSPCVRSRIPISRSTCPATFVSQPKSTHFGKVNPNLLVVISPELRMLPNERFCKPSLKRSSFHGNKGHVRGYRY